MTRRRKLALGGVATAVLATAAGAGAALRGAEGPSTGVTRVERTVLFPWESGCDFDDCSVMIFAQVPLRTPPAIDTVDVTVTVTLDYATSRGDGGEIGVLMSGPDRSLRPVRPGGLRLAPAPKGASTTLTWSQRDVPADAAAYTFEVSVASREGGGDPLRNHVRGRRATVVVEAWTSG